MTGNYIVFEAKGRVALSIRRLESSLTGPKHGEKTRNRTNIDDMTGRSS